jgi:hypothetical protein
MGTITSRANLEFYLRTALEQWTKEYLGGPWDDLVGVLSKVIDDGSLSLEQAARIDYLLRATTGMDLRSPDCSVCDCPMAGLSHVSQGDADGNH